MTTASGNRYRLVTEQSGREHVSSLVLSAEEAQESLLAEAWLHDVHGWAVERYPSMIRAERDGIVRWIWASAREPLEDVL